MTTSTAALGPTPTAVAGNDPLAPVRRALLDHAQRDAEDALAAAEAEAAAVLERAREEAGRLTTQARRDGEHDAEALRREQQARTRRRSRSIVLSAQRAALDELSSQAHRAVRALWDDPVTGPQIRARLTEQARLDLGPDTDVVDHPAGGIEARAAGTKATYLLTDLADEVVARMGADLAGLWTP
jgi:hypothetical protein